MKLIIEAKNMEELMNNLMAEIPMIYADFHCKKKSGGNKIKWSLE